MGIATDVVIIVIVIVAVEKNVLATASSGATHQA
jgi:hypothetical protein